MQKDLFLDGTTWNIRLSTKTSNLCRMDSREEIRKEKERKVSIKFCRPINIISCLLVILIRIITICYVIFSFILYYYEEIFAPDVVAVMDDVMVLGLPVGTSVTTISFLQSSFVFIQSLVGIIVIFGFILRKKSFLMAFEVTNILLLVVDALCLSFFSAIRSNITYITDELRVIFFEFYNMYRLTGVIRGEVDKAWIVIFNKFQCFGPGLSFSLPVATLSYPYITTCYDFYGRKLAGYTDIFLVIGVFSISIEIVCIIIIEREYRRINKDLMWLSMSDVSLWSFRLGTASDIYRAMQRRCQKREKHKVSISAARVQPSGEETENEKEKNVYASLQKKLLSFFSVILMVIDGSFMTGVVYMAFEPALMENSLTSQLSVISYVSGKDSSFTDVIRGLSYGFLSFISLNILHLLIGLIIVFRLTMIRKYNIMYSVVAFISMLICVVLCGLSYHIVQLATCCDLHPTSCPLAPEETISQICDTNKYELRWIGWGSMAYCAISVILNFVCGMIPLTYTCNNKTDAKVSTTEESGDKKEENKPTPTRSNSAKSDLTELEEILGLREAGSR